MPKVRNLLAAVPPPICLIPSECKRIIFKDGSSVTQQPGYWTAAHPHPDGRFDHLRYPDGEIIGFSCATDAIRSLELLRSEPEEFADILRRQS